MTLQTYGHDGTIHDSEHIDVEVDNTGRVVAVWFRCMALPFTQSVADDFRADQMRGHYSKIKLKAVQYDDGLPKVHTLGLFEVGVRKWSEWWCGIWGA